MAQPSGPSLVDVVFSLKTFSAAMLAYWIALFFDLPRPFWAVGTVYIVAHPLAGAITSKAIYRLLGTAIGGVMTLVLVPNLVNAPELLAVTISTWVGLCVFVSLLDRSPRSYVFLLAGYTVLLAGLPLVNTPELAFDTAVSRVEEIGLGIICAALVSRVVFPRHAGPVLIARVDAWLANATGLVRDTLQGAETLASAARERRRLAADAVDMHAFTTHVGYDTAGHSAMAELLRALQQRMVLLLPLLSAIEDDIAALKRADALDEASAAALAQASALMSGVQNMPAEKLDAVAARPDSSDWNGLLRANLARRLQKLTAIWEDCQALRADLAQGSARSLRARRVISGSPAAAPHLDLGMAALSGVAAMAAVLIGNVIWIATGWADGMTVAQIAGVICCLLAGMDDPVPAMRKFMVFTMAAIAIAFVYQFAIFPRLDSIVPLAASLGLVLIPAGILLAQPARYLLGMSLCVNIPLVLGLQSRLNLDAASFINGNIALVLAIGLAMQTSALMRSVGAETSAKRLLHAGWRRIAAVAERSQPLDGAHLEQRLLDTLGLLTPRLAALPPESAIVATDLLRDLRIGIGMTELQRERQALPGPAKSSIDGLLARISEWYRDGKATRLAGELPAAVDACLAATLVLPGGHARATSLLLADLRCALAPDSPAPQPAIVTEERAA